jgi:hypothetical protein
MSLLVQITMNMIYQDWGKHFVLQNRCSLFVLLYFDRFNVQAMNVGGMWAPCLLFCVVHISMLLNFVCLLVMKDLVVQKTISFVDYIEVIKEFQKMDLRRRRLFERH